MSRFFVVLNVVGDVGLRLRSVKFRKLIEWRKEIWLGAQKEEGINIILIIYMKKKDIIMLCLRTDMVWC